MTTYGYECRLDGHFERDFKMGSQPSTIECPVCKDEAVRSYSVPAIAFKGKGFYSTRRGDGMRYKWLIKGKFVSRRKYYFYLLTHWGASND